MEPTVGEQLRFEEFKRRLAKLDDVNELREIAIMLAKSSMVTQPACLRYMSMEAARNLVQPPSAEDWSTVASEIREHLLDHKTE